MSKPDKTIARSGVSDQATSGSGSNGSNDSNGSNGSNDSIKLSVIHWPSIINSAVPDAQQNQIWSLDGHRFKIRTDRFSERLSLALNCLPRFWFFWIQFVQFVGFL